MPIVLSGTKQTLVALASTRVCQFNHTTSNLPLTIYQHNTHIAFPLQIHFVREMGYGYCVMVKSAIGGKIFLEHAKFRRRLPHYRFIP